MVGRSIGRATPSTVKHSQIQSSTVKHSQTQSSTVRHSQHTVTHDTDVRNGGPGACAPRRVEPAERTQPLRAALLARARVSSHYSHTRGVSSVRAQRRSGCSGERAPRQQLNRPVRAPCDAHAAQLPHGRVTHHLHRRHSEFEALQTPALRATVIRARMCCEHLRAQPGRACAQKQLRRGLLTRADGCGAARWRTGVCAGRWGWVASARRHGWVALRRCAPPRPFLGVRRTTQLVL